MDGKDVESTVLEHRFLVSMVRLEFYLAEAEAEAVGSLRPCMAPSPKEPASDIGPKDIKLPRTTS